MKNETTSTLTFKVKVEGFVINIGWLSRDVEMQSSNEQYNTSANLCWIRSGSHIIHKEFLTHLVANVSRATI